MAMSEPDRRKAPRAVTGTSLEAADLSAALAPLLAPGEVVLWIGSPARDRYAKHMQQLWTPDSSCLSRITAGCITLVLIAPFLLAEHAINRLPSPFSWVVTATALGAVIGLFIFIWELGVRFLAAERAAKTIYAITDKRVIESQLNSARTYWPDDLNFLTIRDGSDDVGDVLFSVEPVPVDESPPSEVQHGLIGVKHPHEVGDTLRAAFPQAPFVKQYMGLSE
jgi:hypothetical protein